MAILLLIVLLFAGVATAVLMTNKSQKAEEIKEILGKIYVNLKDLYLNSKDLFIIIKNLLASLNEETPVESNQLEKEDSNPVLGMKDETTTSEDANQTITSSKNDLNLQQESPKVDENVITTSIPEGNIDANSIPVELNITGNNDDEDDRMAV